MSCLKSTLEIEASGLPLTREQLEQAPSIVRKDDNWRVDRFASLIRAETVPQVCWWRDHRGPGQ